MPNNGYLSTTLHDKWDDFYITIIIFSHLDRNIERYKPLHQYNLFFFFLLFIYIVWGSPLKLDSRKIRFDWLKVPVDCNHVVNAICFIFSLIIVTFEPNVNHLCSEIGKLNIPFLGFAFQFIYYDYQNVCIDLYYISTIQ